MARITITTVERLEVHVFTEFSFDDAEVDYEPLRHDAWSLNGQEGVEKHHYSLGGSPMPEEEADAIYRHGESEGAKTQRIQAVFGSGRYDSMPKCEVDGFDDPDSTMGCDELRQAWLVIKSSGSDGPSGDVK
jgi:hypothetical protein